MINFDNYTDEISFSKINRIRKILDNGYTLEKEECLNNEDLRQLSTVKDVSQDTFNLYAKSLRRKIDEREFFLDESVSSLAKKNVIKLAENHKDYKIIIENKYLDEKKLQTLTSFLQKNMNPKLAVYYKHNTTKKDEKYMEEILKIFDEKRIKELFIDGYSLSTISTIAKANKEGINLLDYLNGPKYDKTAFDIVFEMVKIDKDFDKRNYNFYFSHSLDTWKILHTLDMKGFPIEKVCKKMLNRYCLRQLEIMFDRNIDVNRYLPHPYDFLQLEEINKGFEGNIDYTIYDDVSYSHSQMQIIRRALRQNKKSDEKIDVSLICNPSIDASTMQIIVKVLTKGTLDEKLKIMEKFGTKTSSTIEEIER